METSKDGILLLDKPAGETSFRSLGIVKKTLGTRKVGHTGTLDKFATGLLIVLVGRFTKLNALITGMDKVYEAEFTFGRETDTLDPEGAVVAEAPVPEEALVREKMPLFTGPILQRPPLYSAVHIDGQRAHRLARKGVEREMPERPVQVYAFEFLSYREGRLQLRIRCSKGTYVRSLARDLGLACGSRAYVSRLNRSAVGPYGQRESFSPETFQENPGFYPWRDFLDRLPGTAVYPLKERALPLVGNGVPFRPDFLENPGEILEDLTALTAPSGEIAALLAREGTGYRYRINFSRPG